MSFAEQMRGVFEGLVTNYGGPVSAEVRSATYNTRGDETVVWSAPTSVDIIIISVPTEELVSEQGELNIGDVIAYFPYDFVISNGDKVTVQSVDYIVKRVRQVGVTANADVIYKNVLLAKEEHD